MLPQDHEHRLIVKEDRIKHWISVGAQATDRVHKLLGKAGVMDPFVWAEQTKKAAPGKKRAEREAEEAAKAAEAAEAAAAAAAEPAAEEEKAEA